MVLGNPYIERWTLNADTLSFLFSLLHLHHFLHNAFEPNGIGVPMLEQWRPKRNSDRISSYFQNVWKAAALRLSVWVLKGSVSSFTYTLCDQYRSKHVMLMVCMGAWDVGRLLTQIDEMQERTFRFRVKWELCGFFHSCIVHSTCSWVRGIDVMSQCQRCEEKVNEVGDGRNFFLHFFHHNARYQHHTHIIPPTYSHCITSTTPTDSSSPLHSINGCWVILRTDFTRLPFVFGVGSNYPATCVLISPEYQM